MKSIYDFTIQMPNGTEKTLKEYEGKPLIVVNTASKCGLTPQFKGLQELYEKYSIKDLRLLDFLVINLIIKNMRTLRKLHSFVKSITQLLFPLQQKLM